ncbi:MAG: YdcF family protein [Candidatus Omnitrophota bacterium]
MKTGTRKFLITVVVIAVLALTHLVWMPLFAKFLIVKDEIKKADCIVMLCGDLKFDREKKAIELYHAGTAAHIIRILERDNTTFTMIAKLLNSGVTQREAYANYFGWNGVKPEGIILGDAVATSTFDELRAARGVMADKKYRSLILVTSDYHMRRALMTARWVFRGTGVALYHASARGELFHPDRWWCYEDDIRPVVFEYLSMVFYLVYHFALGR